MESLSNYIPGEDFFYGKEELLTLHFEDDFGVMKSNFTFLAGRGAFSAGSELRNADSFDDGELLFLHHSLTRLPKTPIILCGQKGLYIVFPSFFRETGLLAVIHPFADAGKLKTVLLSVFSDFLLSPATLKMTADNGTDFSQARDWADDYLLCQMALSQTRCGDFRRLSADIARLCGCRTNVLQLPMTAFPIPQEAMQQWKAFLLCFFLTVKGTDSKGSCFSFTEVGKEEISILTQQQFYFGKLPDGFSFLSEPCFSSFRLHCKKDEFSLEVILPKNGRFFGVSAGFGDSVILKYSLKIS